MNSTAYIIHNPVIINEGKRFAGDVWIKNGVIEKITAPAAGSENFPENYTVIDATGKYLLPGVIDDQVHFRQPGLEYKADIASESRAAVAGGVTGFMDMPNTDPPAVTIDVLEEKYKLAAQTSLVNYSFYMGTTNDNIDEILKIDPRKVCGIKVFMGSSTGNLLVDDDKALNALFEKAPTLIATHCEDDSIIEKNTRFYLKKYGMEAVAKVHPGIRSAEACYRSSAKAVALAKKFNTRLHVLHLSTAGEMELFRSDIPLKEKKITAEVCVHHLWFSEEDYEEKGNFIKWNPAIKSRKDRDVLRNALKQGKLDVVATDHAPHTLEEKNRPYFRAPSGAPMVQHSLTAMLELAHWGEWNIETVVEKMCHNPAILFNVRKRGFIREGWYADLVLVDMNRPWIVAKENILYKCGWSPLEGMQFHSKILKTFVNGNLVFDEGTINDKIKGKRLLFDR